MYNKASLGVEITALMPKYPANLRTWLFAPKPDDFKAALHAELLAFDKSQLRKTT